MKRLHLFAGIAGILLFLVTGQLLRLHRPPVRQLLPEYRMMFVSRHIYLLGASLVHLMLGLYLRRWQAGWARALQAAGSALLFLSLVMLTGAFFTEPSLGLPGRSWQSAGGLYALLAGAALHAIGFMQNAKTLE
jgi:hypothetical protein